MKVANIKPPLFSYLLALNKLNHESKTSIRTTNIPVNNVVLFRALEMSEKNPTVTTPAIARSPERKPVKYHPKNVSILILLLFFLNHIGSEIC